MFLRCYYFREIVQNGKSVATMKVYRKNYNLISVQIYTNLYSKKFTTSCKIFLRKRPQQAANVIFSAKSFLN